MSYYYGVVGAIRRGSIAIEVYTTAEATQLARKWNLEAPTSEGLWFYMYVYPVPLPYTGETFTSEADANARIAAMGVDR